MYINRDRILYRCFVIDQRTGTFLNVDSNILLSIIIKISKHISRLEQEIKELDFRKLDDKNVKKKRLEIRHEDGITTISAKDIQ